jgi:hypothetical protein
MDCTSNSPADPVRDHLSRLARDLRARTRILATAARIRFGEAKAVAFHIRQQMQMQDGSRSRANLVHAFGAIAEREGYTDLDDLAISGAEHHGQLYAYWMALAATECLASSRGELLRYIFSDPGRLDWCRKEGARLAWEFVKSAREEETALFRKRQETGSKHWRKEPMTARQYYLITLISVRGDIPLPEGLRCGPAHDWIALNGAHPNFWVAPERPPPWRIDGVVVTPVPDQHQPADRTWGEVGKYAEPPRLPGNSPFQTGEVA